MKTGLAVMGLVTLLAGSGLAAPTGAANIIKERAKELNDQNNVRQGVTPPAQPTAPAATPRSAAASAPSPALTQFQADLAAIKISTPVTDQQKKKLTQDLLAVAQGVKPSHATVARFIDDLTAALVENPLPAASRSRLVQELDAVLNPGKYPQAKLDGIFADVQAIFQENALARNKAVEISDDVKALSADLQRGGAK
jgi:hypothetical protein